MTRIEFASATQYEFAEQFVQRDAEALYGTHFRPDELALELRHPGVAVLLSRIRDGGSVVLPYAAGGGHVWIIAGATRRQLERTLARTSQFVVPSYAQFVGDGATPQRRLFNPTTHRLQELGATLYPAGYYSLRSPERYFDLIVRRLGLWLSLEDRRPVMRREGETPRTYRALHERFEEALAAANWPEAADCLNALGAMNATTADNLAFLEVQLLARQQNWRAIWQRPDFGTLASLRTPPAARAALLTAFHHSVLLPLEQQELWGEALEAFKAARPRLGLLLVGRFSIADPPVLQTFAYAAVAASDHRAFADVREAATAELRHCLDSLATYLPPAPAAASVTARLESDLVARQALAEADFDAAIAAASAIDDKETRTLILVQIAFQSGDLQQADDALLAFWGLSETEQARILAERPQVRACIEFLQGLITPSGPAVPSEIRTWAEWLERAEADPDDAELEAALDRLAAIVDYRFWTPDAVRELAERLLPCVLDARLVRHRVIRQAVQYLVNMFLLDPEFPRSEAVFGDLYEMLYTGLLERGGRNQTASLAVLRLAEAILRAASDEQDRIRRNLQEWFATPVPALEGCVIDAFELLADYGVAGALLADWYRVWIVALLGLPRRDDTATRAWLSCGEWIQPGHDLLQRLREQLEGDRADAAEHPIASLPGGFRIGIFSLRRSSAERARSILLSYNPGLDIRLCSEADLNAQAKALAQHAELAVVVTSCISHALTYGIGPLLPTEPVYPASSGSTSIVRAISERLLEQARLPR